jgi:hypothetical protein
MYRDERLGINPFLRYMPIDDIALYVKATTSMPAASGGLVMNLFDGYLGFESSYSEMLGFDFSMKLGYGFGG